MGWGIIILKKDVYLTFCLWLFETSQILNCSQKQSNSRCLRDMFTYIQHTFYKKGMLDLYISAWASALLVQTTMGNAKASNSGTSNRYRFPRFSFYNKYFSKNESFDSGICEQKLIIMKLSFLLLISFCFYLNNPLAELNQRIFNSSNGSSI